MEIERFSIYDYPILLDIYQKKQIGIEDEFNKLGFSRLNSMGLIDYFFGMEMRSRFGNDGFIAKINLLGCSFIEMAFIDINGQLLNFD